jgi:hypothetical protein
MILTIAEEYLDRSDKKITWAEIEKKLGLTTGTISHSRIDGTEMNFATYLNLAKLIVDTIGGDYINLFSDWCLKFKRPKNIKCAFEFLAANGKLEHLELLINNVKQEHNSRDLKDWINAYSIVLMYKRNPKDYSYIQELRGYSPKQLETRIITSLLEVYYLYDQQDYKSMLTIAKSIEESLLMVKEPYIQASYLFRLYQTLAYTYLFRFDDMEKARYYAEKIILSNFCADLAIDSYYIMGMSFFFEDCDKCLTYLFKYVELLERQKRYDLARSIRKNDIPFVQAHWGRTQSSEENISLSEKAHFEAKWGSKSTALEMVQKCLALEGVSPFKLYYKALATGEDNLFLESLIIFSKKGNKFYAKLPYEYLKNHHSLGNAARLLLEIN